MPLLKEIKLYNEYKTYSCGAKDTGGGVGLPSRSPLFSSWIASGTPPDGFYNATYPFPGACWAHNNKLYFTWHQTTGGGRGIYEYSLDTSDPVVMTYTGNFVAIADILAGAATFADYLGNIYAPAVIYDGTYVYILGATVAAGTGYTPILGKWSASNFPFTALNAVWLSPLAQSYGSYAAGEVCLSGYIHLDNINGYLYVVSAQNGQVHTIDITDGSVDGCWAYLTTRQSNAAYRFTILGVNSDGKPIGGNLHASAGAGALYSWNISNLDSWATDTQVMSIGGVGKFSPPMYRRTFSLYAEQDNMAPAVVLYEKALLEYGQNELVFFQQKGVFSTSEYCCRYYNLDTNEDKILFVDDLPYVGPKSFVSINGCSYFIQASFGSAEQYAENPSGYSCGIVATPIGPAYVTYTFTADFHGQPKRIVLIKETEQTLDRSLHPGKHKFRYKINNGEYTSWKKGPDFSDVSDWTAFSPGDVITIQHSLKAISDINAIDTKDWFGDMLRPPQNILVSFLCERVELGGGIM